MLKKIGLSLVICLPLTACGGHSNWEYMEISDPVLGTPYLVLRTADTNTDVLGGQARNLQVICDPRTNGVRVWINTGPLAGPSYQTLYNTFTTYTAFDDEKMGMSVLYGTTRNRPEVALALQDFDLLLDSKRFRIGFNSTTGPVLSVFKTEGLRKAMADKLKGACAQPAPSK